MCDEQTYPDLSADMPLVVQAPSATLAASMVGVMALLPAKACTWPATLPGDTMGSRRVRTSGLCVLPHVSSRLQAALGVSTYIRQNWAEAVDASRAAPSAIEPRECILASYDVSGWRKWGRRLDNVEGER